MPPHLAAIWHREHFTTVREARETALADFVYEQLGARTDSWTRVNKRGEGRKLNILT